MFQFNSRSSPPKNFFLLGAKIMFSWLVTDFVREALVKKSITKDLSRDSKMEFVPRFAKDATIFGNCAVVFWNLAKENQASLCPVIFQNFDL